MALGLSSGQEHEGLDWLIESVPGVPGEDYPIYAEVPDTGFTCDGQVEGGKYADPAAECQVHTPLSKSSTDILSATANIWILL